METSRPQVLIAGAGPTGLVLALWLARSGVVPRIIEKSAKPGLASRAMAVQARTLELYRQLGIADAVVAGGIKMQGLRLRRSGQLAARIQLDDIGAAISPYPFALSFPQDDHERFLGEQLAAAGVRVEWNTELTALQEVGDRVRATLRTPAGEEQTECAYLCGCDGSHSTVRHTLGVNFPGGKYEQRFFVADVAAEGVAADGQNINVCLEANRFCLVFPIRSTGMVRLIGIIPDEFAARESLTFEDLREHVERTTRIQVGAVNWFSAYFIHHRVADHFRVGRAFLAGDAGHVHSPAGGQGMNTGIGDAINLAWKLAAVVRGRADASLLDTYEPERIRFARSLVATTDRAFQGIVSHGLLGRAVRGMFLPYVMPLAARLRMFRQLAFRLISQTRIEYPNSPLSVGKAGVKGGQRLPWVAELDNFRPLQSLDWQVHVYGEASAELRSTGVPVTAFPWCDAAGRMGLNRDAMYLIRPDGYVALADARQDAARLRDYLTKWGIRPNG